MGFLFSLLGSLPGIIGQYFTVKAQVQLAQIQANTSTAADQLQLATTTLAATSARFKQWLIILLFTPFIITIVIPVWAQFIFNNMHYMPQWYIEECVVVFNTVLGISVGTGFVSAMFTHISAFSAQKASTLIQKAQIDKKAFYEALSHLKGTITSADVTTDNAVIDELNKG